MTLLRSYDSDVAILESFFFINLDLNNGELFCFQGCKAYCIALLFDVKRNLSVLATSSATGGASLFSGSICIG